MKKTHYITEPIIFTASRLEAIANRYIFLPMGTTAAVMKILGLLKMKGPLTPRQIMDLAGGTKSNISQRLDTLEKNGFIVRDESIKQSDKRKVVIRLTAKGEYHIEALKKRMRKAQVCLSKHFSEEEITVHLRFFEKLNNIINEGEKNLKKVFNQLNK